MPATGLSATEVANRRARGQVNKVVRRAGRTNWHIIRSNVFTRINAILAILFAIVMTTGSWINGAFGLLIIANSSIGIIQEMRAKRTLDRLTILGESRPRVLRDGQCQEIAQSDIVLDDLIDLGAGDQLVVDGIVRSAAGLKVDESMLTGESDAVHKSVGDKVLSGSFVVAGEGTFQATAIGADAYAARLIAAAGEFTLTGSELQKGIDKILRFISWLLIPTGVLTMWTQLWRTEAPLNEAILAMVASLVPMVPEGLVLMTSIAFAVGVVRLGRRQALVNELNAIEMLARVDVVCVDKTGTLTENRMELVRIRALEGEPEIANRVLSSMAAADNRPNDTMKAIAEDLEGVAPWPVVGIEPFDSKKKWSGVALGEHGTWVLGAPDMLTSDRELLGIISDDSDAGLRVLLLGQVPSFADITKVRPRALVVLQQKVRADAPATLQFFEKEGVDLKVISGDNAVSVAAVARQVGIDAEPVDAREMQPNDVLDGTVFGRVTPEQKRDMVQELQCAGHHVAMTGDGVNDVLALKAADIGVAMGTGAPASRSVAQVVLLDNSFSTLPHVVAEGRRVIGNIERVANLFLTKTIYSVVLAAVIGLWGATYPFQPIHVTMIGWFTIGIPAFFLSLGPNTERARDGFVRRVLTQAVPAGLLISVFTVGFWMMHYPAEVGGQEHRQASTATLVVLLVMAMWVLGIVARPWTWWKVLLVAGGVAGYMVIFLIPQVGQWLLLDASNTTLMLRALCVGAVGAGCIELARMLFHQHKVG